MKLTPPLCRLSLLGACVANATNALMCWQDVIDANHTPTPLYLGSVLCSFNAILLCTCSAVGLLFLVFLKEVISNDLSKGCHQPKHDTD